ncbi:hypothetical protein [Treponema pectinovorum]|uniref:hypothetical protein n=1 Tax=Treponema pectinovorum TaxID=164 RepID=UPI0011F1640D|nr:hypothetical protein [Treponema pectinovorum]
MKQDSVQKKFNLKSNVVEQLKTLAKEEGCSETQIIENAVNIYFSKEILPEHILMGRMNQLQAQLTAVDRKLETLAGIFYQMQPYLIGVLPALPKNEVDKDGKKYNPALDKGNDVFIKLIINYRNQMKAHKISFMQNVWADMQEKLDMTNINAVSEEVYERATGN